MRIVGGIVSYILLAVAVLLFLRVDWHLAAGLLCALFSLAIDIALEMEEVKKMIRAVDKYYSRVTGQ